jgi:serine/threonine-protein kinase
MALPNKAKIPVGTVLAGKYKITREIGRGGMAAVYEAANVDIGKRVAIKVLAQELTGSSVVVERFLREARAAAAIRSPYICDIYDSGRLDDGRPFLVLELLEGESLYERMTKIRWLDVDTTVQIVTQTCRGLTKAHAASIVHRDLKPENLFLTKDEEGRLVTKILDFGLAKFYAPMENAGPQARLTREGAVFGTPAYMSPEQVRGQGAVDHRADLWALGCIVYECFTGRTVWSTEQGVAMTFAQIANAPLPRPSSFRPDLPAGFTAWFDRALNRDITQRFQSAREFSDEFAAVFQKDKSYGIESPSQPGMNLNPFLNAAAQQSVPSIRVIPANVAAAQNAQPNAATEPPPPRTSAPISRPAQGSGATAELPTSFGTPPPPTFDRASPAPNTQPSGAGPVLSARKSADTQPAPGQPSAPGAVQAPPPGPVSAPEAAPHAGPGSGRNSKMGFAGPEPRDTAEPFPPARPGGGGLRRALMIAGGLVIVGGAVVIAWTQLSGPNPVEPAGSASAGPSAPPPASAIPSATVSAAPPVKPPEALPAWMAQVKEAQQAVASGDLKLAQKLLHEAYEKSGRHGLPHTLSEHLAAAATSPERAPCKLAGIGRPRTHDLAPGAKPSPPGRPSIAAGPSGPVVVWTDAHDGPEHAYAVRLDDSTMADVGAPADVTPDGAAVVHPALRRAGDKMVLAYGDARGAEPGVRARFLDADGHDAGDAVKVGGAKSGNVAPAVAAAPDGSFWIAWSDEVDADSEDLFLRKLGADLAPGGDVARATDLVGSPSVRARARLPSIAIASGALFAAYRVEHEPQHLVELIRVPLADAGKGLEPPKKGERRDRWIGEHALVNVDRAKADAPEIACGADGCFVVWHGEGAGGTSLASVDPTRVQPAKPKRWSRGSHPAVAVAPGGGAQVVWYEGKQIFTAPITREGVGVPARIARVTGEQPAPSIAAGARPGEWLVSWLDYELGHVEPYAARVQCK